MEAAYENAWSSSATFRAGGHGRVDPARDAPVNHVYLGTASLGPLGVQTPGRSATVRPSPIVYDIPGTGGSTQGDAAT